MKKVLVLLVICFMALGAVKAMADSRTNALGLTAGQQIDDVDSIWSYPQDAARYGNFVDVRMGNSIANFGLTGSEWFGIVHKDTDDIGYVGIYTLRPFEQSYSVASNANAANQFGVFDGAFGGNWNNAIDPTSGTNSPVNTSLTLGGITATFNHIAIPFAPATPENKLDLFWAKEFSDVTFGVHVNWGDNQLGSTSSNFAKTSAGAPAAGTAISSTGNGDSGVLGVDLGLGLKALGPLDSLDLGVGYYMGMVNDSQVLNHENAGSTGTNATTNNTVKDNGISSIRVNVLGKTKINDTTTGRIYVNAQIDSLGFTGNSLVDGNNDGNYTDAGETNTVSNTYNNANVNVGLACSHKVLDGKAMVVAGFGLIFDDRNYKQTQFTNGAGSGTANIIPGTDEADTLDETWIVVPLNVAIETPLFDWMKARIGLTKNLYNGVTDKIVQPFNLNNANAGNAYQDTNTAQITTDGVGAIGTFIGVGCSFSNWSLDFQLNPGNLITAIQGLTPGNGTLYGNLGGGASANAPIATLAGTITEFDFKYAF